MKPSTQDLDDNVQVLSFGKKAQEIVIEQKELPTSNSANEPDDSSGGQVRVDCAPVELDTELHKFSLTRFQSGNHQLKGSSALDRKELVADMEMFLQAHESESTAILTKAGQYRKY